MRKLHRRNFSIILCLTLGSFCQQSTIQGEQPPVIPDGHDFTTPAQVPYKPGTLLVRFAPAGEGVPRNAAEKTTVLNSLGGATLKRSFCIIPSLSVVELAPGQSVPDALETFNSRNEILYAEPDYQIRISSTVPNDPCFSSLWGMHNTGQTGGTTDADIDAPEAWGIATDANDIIVAVIDSGVDYNHVDLAANMWVNNAELNGDPNIDDDDNGYVDDMYGYDFCAYEDKERDSDPMDDGGHGTHCAGTIGGVGDNGIGVVGACWHVKIMALKFLNSEGSGDTEDGIEVLHGWRTLEARL